MLPYPVLTLFLVLMWLLLNGFSIGHLILGSLIALFASWAMAGLRADRPRIRRIPLMLKLVLTVFYDVINSNLSVAVLILTGRRRGYRPGFVTLHLELEDRTALAVLAVILTSTPGSAWLEYDSNDRSVLIHVLDLDDKAEWCAAIKNRYEKPLLEIFA